jgi:hypothetical protein
LGIGCIEANTPDFKMRTIVRQLRQGNSGAHSALALWGGWQMPFAVEFVEFTAGHLTL